MSMILLVMTELTAVTRMPVMPKQTCMIMIMVIIITITITITIMTMTLF